jgi:hypothetical protein
MEAGINGHKAKKWIFMAKLGLRFVLLWAMGSISISIKSMDNGLQILKERLIVMEIIHSQ